MIHDILPVNNYRGNNSATTFDFDFYIDSASQLKVNHFNSNGVKTLLTLGIDYSINEIRNRNGSFIVFPLQNSDYSVLKDDENISIELSLPVAQETQYNNSSLLNLEALEYSFDYLTRLIQILYRKMSLCVKTEECSDYTPDELLNRINSIAAQVNNTYSAVVDCAESIEDYYDDISAINDRFDSIVEQFDNIDTLSDNIDLIAQNKANTSLSNISEDAKIIFDGQWTAKFANCLTSTAVNSYTIDLSDYLPSDNSAYEVFMIMEGYYDSSASEFAVGTVADPVSNHFLGGGNFQMYQKVAVSSRGGYSSGFLPISTSRTMYCQISGGVLSYFRLYLYGYRRIGTNT